MVPDLQASQTFENDFCARRAHAGTRLAPGLAIAGRNVLHIRWLGVQDRPGSIAGFTPGSFWAVYNDAKAFLGVIVEE